MRVLLCELNDFRVLMLAFNKGKPKSDIIFLKFSKKFTRNSRKFSKS